MRVLAAGEEMDQTDAAEALEVLNDMMHSWASEGMDYTHTSLALGDTFPLASSLHQGVKAMLAVRLADDYMGGQLTPGIARDASNGMKQLLNTYITLVDSEFDPVFNNMNRRYI